MLAMNSSTLQTWALRGALTLVLVAAFVWVGWVGLAAAVGALVMWALVQFTRTLKVLQRAAMRPKAQVDSAVMLHAHLQENMSLLQVLKITACLGEALSPEHQQPEIFCWRDPGQVQVICRFQDGKLTDWQLERPIADAAP
jgi:hypothetical protein